MALKRIQQLALALTIAVLGFAILGGVVSIVSVAADGGDGDDLNTSPPVRGQSELDGGKNGIDNSQDGSDGSPDLVVNPPPVYHDLPDPRSFATNNQPITLGSSSGSSYSGRTSRTDLIPEDLITYTDPSGNRIPQIQGLMDKYGISETEARHMYRVKISSIQRFDPANNPNPSRSYYQHEGAGETICEETQPNGATILVDSSVCSGRETLVVLTASPPPHRRRLRTSGY